MYINFNAILEEEFDANFLRTPHRDNLNCTPPDILEFPNFMRKKNIGYVIISILISLYLFLILAIVCDDYLVPAMERLCYGMRMSYDVAGATFLAAATSAPELFVSIVGTCVTKGDIGVGTIVGSSVFNVLGIAAFCGIFVSAATQMDWWPITRDTFWYMVSILLLFGVLYDSKVVIYEAAGLLSFYILYIVALACDRRLQGLVGKQFDEDNIMKENPMEREEDPLKTFKETIMERPDPEAKLIVKIWWAIKYPAVVLLAITTPSARSIFPLSMLLAVIWISIISYFITWLLTIVGYNIGIPDSIMGLTVLAIGTSVPEIISSYIVCMKGYGSMAMCNAIGSNTFDIFICLGLPWTIMILASGKNILINSQGLSITTGLLIGTGLLVYICFLITKFSLNKFVGWSSFIMYVLFLIISSYIEVVTLPTVCDIESEDYLFLNYD
ncbi:sodium/potassium/calcium exchanger 3 isoform X1 [Drosophila nasuta]|uniref:sodium/potassium/calcium exchanger 3 isoform X1 n=1 Tax=Drosophila nasuta TaxID=42062 RepID=UPI00295E3AF3|nr:sodium/potassium/calcium exchanger 3 isoform X1 [Drosophila nasuta]